MLKFLRLQELYIIKTKVLFYLQVQVEYLKRMQT